jgi:predicted ATPase/DNA-binding CsgD family transcriptional regulator/DNA-binding XRE family transcriptional regulator/Tfp pilus assembly protein PilF
MSACGSPLANWLTLRRVDTEPLVAVPLTARIRLLRAKLGMSQEQLARQLGVSFATVNRWESGRSQPSARARRAIDGLAGAATKEPEDLAGHGPAAVLPVAQSSFVGRERELAELAGLLARSRLVTLTGPGGAGKTRLAIETARRLTASGIAGEAAVFVPLEHVRPPQSAASAIASRLGLRDKPGVPLRDTVLAALRGGPRLLLIDRAEHHRDEVALLASELLPGAPDLRILVTSRIVLDVAGEVCWAVPPLDCPSVTAGAPEIASCDAVRLFIARAGERLPGFSLADAAPHAVGELCRRLGGLPLAIELIAGWVGTLSIGEIVQQRAALLDYGRPGSQGGRRLTDVLRASYDLLSPDQQKVLRMLSAFAEPASLPDVAAVLNMSMTEITGPIRELVDSSWLVVTRGAAQNRFGMVEAVRMYAAACLEDAGESAQVRLRHARHFAVLAKDSENALAGAESPAWTKRMEEVGSDLDAVLHWAAETGDEDLGLEVSAALWRWWLASGRLAVGRSWLARFLAAAGQPGSAAAAQARRTERLGQALIAAAVLAAETDDYPEAVRQSRLALDIFEPLGGDERVAFAATVLGSAQRYLGERAEARRSFSKAMEVRAAAGDRHRMMAAMNNMALVEIDDGNLDRARELFEQTLLVKRQLGDPRSIAIGLMNLADTLIRLGRWQTADAALREAVTLIPGQPQLMGIVLCNQGHLAARQGKWKQAAERYEASVQNSRIGGHSHDMLEAMIGLGRACHRLGKPAEATRHLRTAEALAGDIANQGLLAEVRAALAEVSGGQEGQLPGGLTTRQAEVLRLLADGLSNKQIAERLCLSPGTVERHLAMIYRKLGFDGRVKAARYAVEHGLAGGGML